MLDENLPTFCTKPSSDNPLSSTLFLSQYGNKLQAEYTLCRPDPQLPASRNCYGLAIFDSYNPEVLFAEVCVQPEWTQPTLSQAEIRAQNGVPVPPVPVVPDKFAIQLYNPEVQVIVRQIPGTWKDSAYWKFEMPQNSFRMPSASELDRHQSNPAASDVTPKVPFKWKRDGKLSKDISCYLTGETVPGKKSKEPDIPVAMYKDGKSLTIYQPNMHRVEIEDTKGLEVVFLLSAAVIKDIFLNPNREMFNIYAPNTTDSAREIRGSAIANRPTESIMSGALSIEAPSHSMYSPSGQPGITVDTQKQREIDAETARLKELVEKEARDRERAGREEQKRIKKMLEAEEKEQQRREAEVAKETERLRKQYGVTGAMESGPSRVNYATPAPLPPKPQQQQFYQPQKYPQFRNAQQPRPQPHRPLSTSSGTPASRRHASSSPWLQRPQNGSPYLQAPGSSPASSSGFFGLGGKKLEKKRSVFF
ncbi:hypothetical protein BJ878DRAFT_438153 [Calycina marina]|uniref:Uncharacterized protein n=1 Tax=Calycina marina TaxID=1763456 RepID=A0A9P7Z5L8_9HELO|nr:hypothetical protein BJ878DRAFT_438153 [Calycina marina]